MIDWKYEPLGVNSISGRNTTQDNFTSETKDLPEILVRELIQNSLDAKSPNRLDPVRIKITQVSWSDLSTHDTEYIRKLFPKEYRDRLGMTSDHIPNIGEGTPFLLLEDFGTTGLLGIYDAPRVDDPKPQNWNAFWFREGEGDKLNDFANGRAGQGKVTYYSVSGSRSIFALTIRETDNKSLVFGRSLFSKDYKYQETHFNRIAFWSISQSAEAKPSECADDITKFKKHFHLNRKDEPGLSIVIPDPIYWDMNQITKTIVEDFFLPIMSGKLIVQLGNLEFNKENILDQNRQYLEDKELSHKIESYNFLSKISTLISSDSSPLFNIEEKWFKSKRDVDPFGDNLTSFLNMIEKHDIIHLRCSIQLQKKKEHEPIPSRFDIYIQKNDIQGKAVQFYSRLDMMIAEEKNQFIEKLESFTILTHIKDRALSQFLNDAETPTHLKWNAQNSRLKENWESYRKELSLVRNAAEYIMKVVLQLSKTKDDLSTLAIYFPALSKGGEKGPGKKPVPQLIKNLSPAKLYSHDKIGFTICADEGYDDIEDTQRVFTVKFSYSGGGTKDGKILKKDSLSHEHINIKKSDDSEVVFTPINKDFKLKFSGLSNHIPVSASLEWSSLRKEEDNK